MTLPTSYQIQNGCHNCKYLLFLMNYEYWDGVCGLEATPQELSLYRRHEGQDSPVLSRQEASDFYAWEHDKKVQSHGICDNWKQNRDSIQG